MLVHVHDPQAAALGPERNNPAKRAQGQRQAFAAVLVGKAQVRAGDRTKPQSIRTVDQTEAAPGGRAPDGGALVEPAVQVPPFPVAQGPRRLIEFAGGVHHVVAVQRCGRGGNAGTVGLAQGRLFLRVRLPRVGVRPVPLLVRFQPFPGHSHEPASQRSGEKQQQRRDPWFAPAPADQPGSCSHRPCGNRLPFLEAQQVLRQRQGAGIAPDRLLLQTA